MLNKILIPLDGSELAERALTLGVALAQKAEATVIVLRSYSADKMLVSDPFVVGSFGTVWPAQSLKLACHEATDYLESVCKHKMPAGCQVQTELAEGDPAAAIVETARAQSAGLIVMSSHGYSGITRWVLGSVAERVLNDSPCPVLMVRSVERLQHMLIPLDGSPLSEQVLEVALAIAEIFQCKVTFLRAIQPIDESAVVEMETIERGLGRTFEVESHRAADDYLRHALSAARNSRYLPDTSTIVMHRSPAESILDYAGQHAVDVIAMSTHGRTGLQRWIYGSVTEKVLHASHKYSMLVMRPHSRS